MFGLPNHPVRRIRNFFDDIPPGSTFWDMRWPKKRVNQVAPVSWLTVPKKTGIDTPKSVNSSWRPTWQWILIEVTGDRCCHLFFARNMADDTFGRQKLTMIRTRYVAMRIGDTSFDLVSIDRDGETHMPEIVMNGHLRPIVGEIEEIQKAGRLLGGTVTFC